MEKLIHLQGYGKAKAIEAGKLIAGSITVWNYGGKEIIKEKIKETDKTIWFITEWEDYDKQIKQGKRKFLKSRLVGIIKI